MVFMSIERWYAVAHPYAHRAKCTRKFNTKLMACIATMSNILATISIILTYFFTITGMCNLTNTEAELLSGALYSIAWSVLIWLLPWMFIFFFTGITGWKLVGLTRERRQMTSEDERGAGDHKVTIMVMLSFINFVVWSIPEVGVRVYSILKFLKLTYLQDTDIFNLVVFVGIEWKCLVHLIIYFGFDKEIREQIVLNFRRLRSCRIFR